MGILGFYNIRLELKFQIYTKIKTYMYTYREVEIKK